MKVRQNQYDLYMRVDTNTYGHRQWFYFSIKNKIKKTIKINIYRFRKPYSLYQRGMKPYVRSLKSQEKDWQAGGYNVRYIKQKQTNDYGVKKGSGYYYLTFNYKFQNDQDQVFFAAGIPYDYSFLKLRLLNFQDKANQSHKIKMTQQVVGISPCGLEIPMIKVQPAQINELYCKHIIAINCRTHPGQVSASWVLDGLIDHILSQEEAIINLMTQFNLCFHILPMLNPDGVFFGNYRTGIVGDDFNRKFSSGRKDVFPQIYCLKKMITLAKKQGKLKMFIDLHGHSILKNSFIYGPSQKDFCSSIFKKLPFNLWHKSQYFKLSSCKFLTQSSKIQTARMYFQLKENVLSYTCENSLGLYGSSNGHTFQMTKQDWRKFGFSIIEAINPTVENEKGKFTLFEDKDTKKQEDLRETSTPPLQQSARPIINKRLQISTKLKLKTQKFYQSSGNNQSFDMGSKICQNTSKTISKGQKLSSNIRKRKLESSFFSGKQSPTKKSSILTQQQQKTKGEKENFKLSQVRQRLPSLSLKQVKSKQVINDNLRPSQKNIREEIFSKDQQESRNRTQQKQRKKLGLKKDDSLIINSKYLPQQQKQSVQKHIILNGMKPKQKNNKKQFIQSIYNDHQLKQLKKFSNKHLHFSLGSKLTPVIENIKHKLQLVNNSNHAKNKQSKICHPLSFSVNEPHTVSSFAQAHNNQPIKKYSCDFVDLSSNDKGFDNIQISLKSCFQQRRQRSITYDQSFLQTHIQKIKEIQQIQKKYYKDQSGQIQGWSGENNQMKFDDNFSQNFDDSLNDSDSGDEDLPEQQKKHIFQYIRSHNSYGQRAKFFQCNQSDQEKDTQKKQPVQIQKFELNKKRNINGFREIVFKHGNDGQDEQVNVQNEISLNIRSGLNNSNIPKLRKNPHKFKQSSGSVRFKSFSTKIQPQQKDNQDEIYITHKKKLNQRNIRRQSRKDPFILVSRKQKYVTGGKIYSNL